MAQFVFKAVGIFGALIVTGGYSGYLLACDLVKAPAKFVVSNVLKSTSGRPTNGGIKPKGFVDLDIPVVHGIDVSKYQDEADFGKAYECGARFAYVRLTGGTDLDNELQYRVHWANARVANLIPGPYHSLSILPDSIKQLAGVTPEVISDFAKKTGALATSSANAQAKNFSQRLLEVKSLDPNDSRRTRTQTKGYLPAVLGLTTDPLPLASLDSKLAFGKIYQEMACSFIEGVRKNLGASTPVILLTTADIYKSYALNQSRCDLSTMPVWISHRPLDGDKFNSKVKKGDAVELLCRDSSKASRCIFDQYTSYGGFVAFGKDAGLDLNRFYGTMDQLLKLVQE